MAFAFDPTLAVHDLIQDLKWSAPLRKEFASNERSVLDRYDLLPDEREALEKRDFYALYRMGLHPYLGGQLARLIYGNQASTVPGQGAKRAVDELVKSLTQGRDNGAVS